VPEGVKLFIIPKTYENPVENDYEIMLRVQNMNDENSVQVPFENIVNPQIWDSYELSLSGN